MRERVRVSGRERVSVCMRESGRVRERGERDSERERLTFSAQYMRERSKLTKYLTISIWPFLAA